MTGAVQLTACPVSSPATAGQLCLCERDLLLCCLTQAWAGAGSCHHFSAFGVPAPGLATQKPSWEGPLGMSVSSTECCCMSSDPQKADAASQAGYASPGDMNQPTVGETDPRPATAMCSPVTTVPLVALCKDSAEKSPQVRREGG